MVTAAHKNSHVNSRSASFKPKGPPTAFKHVPLTLFPPSREVQSEPIAFRAGHEDLAAVKIDRIDTQARGQLRLEGWATGDLVFELMFNGKPLSTQTQRFSRSDVANLRNVPEDDQGHGLVITAAPVVGARRGRWELQVTLNHTRYQSTHAFMLEVDHHADLSHDGHRIQPVGFLEAASACPMSRQAVVVGWAVVPHGSTLWIEQAGHYQPIDETSIRFTRKDVVDAFRGTHGDATMNAGFVARVDEVSIGQPVHLAIQQDDRFITVGSTQVNALSTDPATAAKWLFGLYTPAHLLAKRIERVDLPVMDVLIAQQKALQRMQPVDVHELGTVPINPRASIVIPLYGRLDFVEHQLIEFARDPWIVEHAEVIYVMDDPELVAGFTQLAQTWHRLYRVPFKWVWGGTNRGFSGANNLGTQHSCGQFLVFLNSDAFPQQPGWIQTLIEELESNPGLGAVAPRLVFGDGSLQHAGMEFVRREELGIWINHHPRMGLDPSLDNHQVTTSVPSVTGACMVIERELLQGIGGWDTGYLIGDFEDSDLCLKLRAEGLRVAYVPQVQLTHLERQSFRLLGQDDFRQKVVIYNAVRHQVRWSGALRELAVAP